MKCGHSWARLSFWTDKNIPELGRSDGFTTLYAKNCWVVHFKKIKNKL